MWLIFKQPCEHVSILNNTFVLEKHFKVVSLFRTCESHVCIFSWEQTQNQQTQNPNPDKAVVKMLQVPSASILWIDLVCPFSVNTSLLLSEACYFCSVGGWTLSGHQFTRLFGSIVGVFFLFTSVWTGVNKLKTKKNNSLRAVFNEPSLMLTTCGAVGQI